MIKTCTFSIASVAIRFINLDEQKYHSLSVNTPLFFHKAGLFGDNQDSIGKGICES